MTRAAALSVAVCALGLIAWSGQASSGGTVARLRVQGTKGAVDGTAFLIHVDRDERQAVHYFLTAGPLLDPVPLGDYRTASLRVRITVDDSTVLETTGERALFPGGLESGELAVLTAVAADVGLQPMPVSFESPQTGQSFIILDPRGIRLWETVRFRSTRLLLGDRTSVDVSGLMGAPALIDGRAIGLVTECSTSRVPVVTLLSSARAFLSRVIQGWQSTSVTVGETLDGCQSM